MATGALDHAHTRLHIFILKPQPGQNDIYPTSSLV